MRLPFGIAIAGCIAATALVLHVFLMPAGAADSEPQPLPMLFVAAFLCVAALLRSVAPGIAWLAAVAAGGLAAIEVVGAVRSVEAGISTETWRWLIAVAEAALVAAAGVAAAYATRVRGDGGGSPARWWRALVLGAFLIVVAVGIRNFVVALLGEGPSATGPGDAEELSSLRIGGRLATGFVAAAALAGMWRDFSTVLARARKKSAGVGDLPRALVEELLPRAAAFRDRGRDEERARLAADLHALVLPDLRRATRTAEAAGEIGQPLAAELRHAVEGVERLMHERQSVVFEEFGLVAALEWLAERTQEQAPIDVVLELDASTDDPDALPKPVTRAAFRVAILAVDNVVRHAAAGHVVLELATGPDDLVLSIIDDGHGLPVSSGGRSGGRGLVDMRAAAQAVGASVAVRSAADGTTVEFRWAAGGRGAGDHASAVARPTDGPSAPQP